MKQSAKFILYAAIGILQPLVPAMAVITPEKLAAMIWTNWAAMAFACLLSMLLTLKALMSPTEKDNG
jgi:hypothetical protein